MSDETQAIDPIEQAQEIAADEPAPAKPKAKKTAKVADKKKRLQPGLKEVLPAEPKDREVEAAADEAEAEIDAPEEDLPDGPGHYEIELRNCKRLLIKNATGRDHAVRAFKRHYGIIRTDNEFTVAKVA